MSAEHKAQSSSICSISYTSRHQYSRKHQKQNHTAMTAVRIANPNPSSHSTTSTKTSPTSAASRVTAPTQTAPCCRPLAPPTAENPGTTAQSTPPSSTSKPPATAAQPTSRPATPSSTRPLPRAAYIGAAASRWRMIWAPATCPCAICRVGAIRRRRVVAWITWTCGLCRGLLIFMDWGLMGLLARCRFRCRVRVWGWRRVLIRVVRCRPVLYCRHPLASRLRLSIYHPASPLQHPPSPPPPKPRASSLKQPAPPHLSRYVRKISFRLCSKAVLCKHGFSLDLG